MGRFHLAVHLLALLSDDAFFSSQSHWFLSRVESRDHTLKTTDLGRGRLIGMNTEVKFFM